MKHYRVQLRTKPYLRKYLERKYGSPLIIDASTDFGDIIITKLSSNLSTKMDAHDIDVRLQRLTDTVMLHIPMDWFYRLRLKDLTDHQVVRINRYFENIFEADLHDIVHRAHVFFGIQRQTAIECFAHNHGIIVEQDISFEGLKKMEYRFRMAHQPTAKVIEIMADHFRGQLELFGT